ncbi:MAG TPA: NAD-dependent epimerase/dehydratase family protein [candidate division Zixibacteria bacterium]|nr:NAD-dependent epimerase/dehydratase family protein [candidate division Zixibacteria bacterium]
MQVFITGGTGFIGSHLVEALNKRDIVPKILRRDSSSLDLLDGLDFVSVIGDILDSPQSIAEAMTGSDWVFHVAALSDYRWQDDNLIYKVNVEGTKNLISAAMQSKVSRFIFTSSLSALGIPNPGAVMDETNQFNLPPDRFPYGHSKHLAEIEVHNAVEEGFPAIILNPTGVVGPRGINQTVSSLFVEASKGRLRFYPPGGMNVIAVQDVVEGHIAAAVRGRVGENYILAGENVSYREAFTVGCEVAGQKPPIGQIPGWLLPPLAMIASALHKVIGDKLPLESNQIRLAGRKIYADGGKAVRDLGLPQTPFKVTVQQAYDWYLEHGHLN